MKGSIFKGEGSISAQILGVSAWQRKRTEGLDSGEQWIFSLFWREDFPEKKVGIEEEGNDKE
jgi:hypothetical protein